MVSSVARSLDPYAAYAAQFETLRVERARAVDDLRVRAENVSQKIQNGKVEVTDLAYAIGRDGRVYAVDHSVSNRVKISIPGRPVTFVRPLRQGELPVYPAATFLDFVAPRIQLSPSQEARLFDIAGEERGARQPQQEHVEEDAQALALEAEHSGEQGFFPINGLDLQTATTSEPIRAAQSVSAFARTAAQLDGAGTQAAKSKAAGSVASFYSALANAPLAARQNLIDIAA